MKTHSLFVKTLAILVALAAALGVAVVVTSSQRIDQMLTEQYVSKGTAIAESIAGSSVEVLLYRDSSTVQATIDQYLSIQGVAYVFVEDRQGDIISHTFAPSIPDSVRHLKGDRHKSTSRLVAGEGIGECIDVTAPLLAGEVGFVHVGMDRQLIHAAIRAAIVEQIAMMSAILFFGLLAAYFLVKKITQPLNKLTNYARELADDDSMTAKAADDALAPIAGRLDEVGQLAQAFRHMVQEVSRRELGLRLAEETLRRSESHFRSLIENVTDIILKVNAAGNAAYVSPSVRQVLGFEPEQFLTHNLLDLIHASDLDRVKETFGQACRQTESIGGVEFRLQHQDGSYRLVDASFNNLLADPSVQSLIVTLRDITEHRRTEELWRIADENQRLVAAIPSILIKLDNEGRVTKWNPAAEETFMVAADAAVGMPLDALANVLEAAQLTASIRDSMAARRHVSLDDTSFTRPDGIRRHLSISITPIFGPDGGPQGVLLLGTDTTERRNLETQLTNSQKLESIGQLAAGIAHEINTPIQYVGDNVAFLKNVFTDIQNVLDKQEQFLGRAKGGTLSEGVISAFEQAVATADLPYLKEEVPRAIEQTLDGVGRVAKIVRAMKEFSHPGSEGKVASDVNKLIDNTITVANNEWKYVADLVRDFDPALPLVPCIAGEFNQVILNLIVNAAHAIGDSIKADPGRKGIITVTTRAAGEEVEIRVKDTGTGIPVEARTKIFDPFFTTKAVGKGTGQGLTIAHGVIVKKHGGRLSFETEMGVGTTFVIHLPAPAALASSGIIALPPQNGRRQEMAPTNCVQANDLEPEKKRGQDL